MKKTIIVTRHKALVQHLIEQGIITAEQAVETIENATIETVQDAVVIGVLPIHLIAACAVFVYVAMGADAPRGVELTIEQVRQYAQPVSYFVAKQVPSIEVGLRFNAVNPPKK